MNDLGKIREQIESVGLSLPAGHPKPDGKIHRFGPKEKKSGWYRLTEIALASGRVIYSGHYGRNQGENHNAQRIEAEQTGWSAVDRAAWKAAEAEAEQAVREERAEEARLAAGRAKHFWARSNGPLDHAYLAKKQVTPEVVRVNTYKDGCMLVVPMYRHRAIVGLQKIAADGSKTFSKGMDKNGALCPLGSLDGAKIIAIGEGWATCRSVRMATNEKIPVVVAFDAGNLGHVANYVRNAHPRAKIIMLADDDAALVERMTNYLADNFGVADQVLVDGIARKLPGKNGQVDVCATWLADVNGIDYLRAEVSCGRVNKTLTYTNAGVARCTSAARAVGNAVVAVPQFPRDGIEGNDWNDWNDLHCEFGLATVAKQLRDVLRAPVLPAAQPPDHDSPAPPPVVVASELSSATSVPVLPAAQPPDHDSPAPPPVVVASELSALPDNVVRLFQPITLKDAFKNYAAVAGKSQILDLKTQKLISRNAFKCMFLNKNEFDDWLNSSLKRIVELEDKRANERKERFLTVADETKRAIERYIHLHGSESVWDTVLWEEISHAALRKTLHDDVYPAWKNSNQRKMVNYKNLIFDPANDYPRDDYINKFKGLPLTPIRDDKKAQAIVQLLFTLCSGEDNAQEVLAYLLSWLAYPLQNKGAKMQSAVLMFGVFHGLGKSLFFDKIMRAIYGDYGKVCGQTQLFNKFNDYQEDALYLLFEEIASQEDKWAGYGLIKWMVTGETTMLEAKFKNAKPIRNYFNSVVLSNSIQAVALEEYDRRFLVINAIMKISKELISEITIGKNIRPGYVEAFYYMLLNLDLTGFDEHSEPPHTAARQSVIKVGRRSYHRFFHDWVSGMLPEKCRVPFCSARSEDLFAAYKIYCEYTGARSVDIETFSPHIKTYVRAMQKNYKLDSVAEYRMVFCVDSAAIAAAKTYLGLQFYSTADDRPVDPRLPSGSLELQINEFRHALKLARGAA
jgi:phage/plasmid primase-like uncharacterized protein